MENGDWHRALDAGFRSGFNVRSHRGDDKHPSLKKKIAGR